MPELASVIVTNGTIFDSTGTPPYPGSVLIDGDRIRAVVKQDHSLPPAAKRIDAEGGTIMPGLIDCHDHQTYHNTFGFLPVQWRLPRDVLIMRSVVAGCDALRHGVTTIREMGAPGATNIAMKRAVDEGIIVGPRIVSCGCPLAITGGHAYEICVEVDGVDQVRRMARQQLRDGADFVKLMASNEKPIPGKDEQTVPQFTLDELRAAVEEAHEAGVKVAVHVCGSRAIERCLDAGVDSIEHAVYLNRDLAQRMAEQGVFYTPTLGIYRANFDPHWQRGNGKAAFCRRLAEDHIRSFAIAVEVGLRWTIGTDAIVPIATEMQHLVDAGLDHETVLLAATRTNAELIERSKDLGTIEVGKLADIIVVYGNPLEDLSALSKVQTVIQNGVVCDPNQLLPMLPSQTPPPPPNNLR